MTTAEVIVIGAGISGLTAAFTLHRAKRSVLVLEASTQSGGLIQTIHENGYRMEAGPNTFPNTATELLNLCQQLELTPKATHPLADKRFLYLHERLLCLPQSPVQALTSPVLSLGAKWRVLQEPLQPKTAGSDTSVAEFFSRRVGAEVANNLADPFIGGIYAGDLTKLSLPAVFPKLWQWEQTNDSLFQGARNAKRTAQAKRVPMQLLGFENGLAMLPQTLANALPPEALLVGQTVTRIQPVAAGYRITTHTGAEYQGTHVILALPAYASAPLLQPFLPEAAKPLAKIPYNGLAVVHTGFTKGTIPHPLDGFGCLIPRHANLMLLGSIWTSSIFPDRAPMGQVLLSNFIGGAHHPEVAAWPEVRIIQTVCENLQQIFKTRQVPKPVFQRVLTYQRAIPQYTLGHIERIQHLKHALEAHPHVQVCGNFLQGVALNECVKSGLAAAERIISPQ